VSQPAFEAFLARLYTDAELRAAFLADPPGVARNAALNDAEIAALDAIDRQGWPWRRTASRRSAPPGNDTPADQRPLKAERPPSTPPAGSKANQREHDQAQQSATAAAARAGGAGAAVRAALVAGRR
jgi:hypothetical protein